MDFDWDEQKRRKNLEKHGVDFYDAYLMFQTRTIQERDRRRDYGEPRYIALGEWGDRILVVAFTVREGTIRIISARKANRREQKRYWKQKGNNS
jgi:hypothetical protein